MGLTLICELLCNSGLLRFYLAYQDPVTKDMVTDLGAIRWHYIKTMFFPDVLFMFPWAAVILTATPSLYWIPATGNQTAVVPSLNYSLSAPSPPNSIISLAVPLDVPNVVLYVSILGLLKLVSPAAAVRLVLIQMKIFKFIFIALDIYHTHA